MQPMKTQRKDRRGTSAQAHEERESLQGVGNRVSTSVCACKGHCHAFSADCSAILTFPDGRNEVGRAQTMTSRRATATASIQSQAGVHLTTDEHDAELCMQPVIREWLPLLIPEP